MDAPRNLGFGDFGFLEGRTVPTTKKHKAMNIKELMNSGAQVNVTVSLMDLKEFALELIEEGKRMGTSTKKEDVKLSAEEASKRLHVTKNTLWRWEKNGYLVPAGRIGNRPVYLQSQIDAMVANAL